MTESRKRPMSPDNLGPSRKRRIISASDWSKPITLRIQQGEDDDEEVVADQLERFQKEAIFRRMKHYARMYHDTSQRLKDTEDRVYVKESAVAAVDACWNQLVSQVQSLIPNGLPPIDDSSLDIYNITRTLDVSEADERSISLLYQQRLREVASVTQRLLGAFVGLAPKAPHPSVEQLKMDNAALRADSTAYRSEARLLRSRLQETTSELESYRELLAIAENKIERVRSETVVILEAKVGRSLSSEEDGKKDVQMANGSPSEMNGTPNGVEPGSEEEIWKSIAEGREARIEVLSKEVGDLMQEVTRLKAELQDPTEATVAETVHYKKLFAHLSELKTNAEEANERATRLTEEVAELRTLRLDMQNAVQAQLSAKLDEMKSTIQKLQNDNNRIRGMRDALTNEVAMLKAKDSKMLSMAKEMKSINVFQKERIVSLVKETQRLRAALAVETGDQDYYAFIADNNEEGVSYVAALRTKLKDAERRVSALEKTIEGLHTSHPDVTRHLKSEAEARQLLAQAQERLEKYERVYGSSSGSNAAESKKLVELVAEKDETLRAIMTLKRKEDERTHGDSTAMDDLCRQVEELIAMKEKEVFDHNALEEKVSRAQAEKTKAETKYFAAMRLKDAAEAERKNAEAALQKQLKRTEKLQESEQALKQQIHLLEKLAASAKQELTMNQQTLFRLEDEAQMTAMIHESQSKRVAELDRDLKERQEIADARRHQIRKLEEENTRLKREVARAEHRAELSVPRSGSPTELSKQNDNLLRILKCSTCTKEFRSHVLTKCMHTFCKSCIDARLSTRQRKCPACQLSFAQSDVQSIYFQ